MENPNYGFDKHRSLGDYSRMRKETILKAITADIEYNYNIYSDKEYIKNKKNVKC
jgi:hypothetical protein